MNATFGPEPGLGRQGGEGSRLGPLDFCVNKLAVDPSKIGRLTWVFVDHLTIE